MSVDHQSTPPQPGDWARSCPFSPTILILKGGGVKGIAYVGALSVLHEYGFRFDHFVGSSAGAIAAALLTAVYSVDELGDVLKKTDFNSFKDDWLPVALLLLPIRKGLYPGKKFRAWLEKLLRAKFPELQNVIEIRSGHLKSRGGRLTVFTSTKGRRYFPFDSGDPLDRSDRPSFSISFACRCSMAIPYFFTPETIEGEYVVDGGTQNNYPVFALCDFDPSVKAKDFIGLYLGHKNEVSYKKLFTLDLFSIFSEASDREALDAFIDRTVVIDPRPIRTTDFSLSEDDTQFLLAEGRASALQWLYHSTDRKPPLESVNQAVAEAEKLRQERIEERWWRSVKRTIVVFVLIVAVACLFIPVSTMVRADAEPKSLCWHEILAPEWYTRELNYRLGNRTYPPGMSERTYRLNWVSEIPEYSYRVELSFPVEYRTYSKIYRGIKGDVEPVDLPGDGRPVIISLPAGLTESYYTVILPIPDEQREQFEHSKNFAVLVKGRVSIFGWLRRKARAIW
jgi:predicted acylesterase/phospholipase RssA